MTDGGWHDSEHQPVLAAGADGANWMATTGADGAWTLRLNGEAVGDPAGPDADGSVAAAEEWLGSNIDDPEIVTYMAARITRQPADPPA